MSKRMTKGICSATICVLIALGAAAPAAYGQVSLNVMIGVPPPPLVVEVIPVPRPGYIWAPGYWAWHDERHIWVRGSWIMGRPGHYWAAEHWEQRGNRWQFAPGRWERDRGRGHEREHGRRHGRGRG